MVTPLGWKPLPLRRWEAICWVLDAYDEGAANNLSGALPKLRLAWRRLGDDLERFFVPAGPPGTHAHAHYHPPVDPDERRDLIDACVVDYESALLFLDVALDATARGLGAASGLGCAMWKRLVTLAEDGHTLAPAFVQDVLYLQRTVLWARNKAVAHPQDHLLEVSWDNSGNLIFWRLSPDPPAAELSHLDELLRRARPDMPPNAVVGNGIPAHMALTWIGTYAGLLCADDRKLFEALRAALGFQLPPPHEIADATSRFLEGVRALVPTEQRGRIALATAPDRVGELPPPEIHPPDHPLAGEGEISAAYDLRETRGPDAALAALEPLAETYPDSALVHIALADVCADLRRYEDAIVHCRVAGAIGWTGPEMREKLAECHFNLAAAAYNAQDMAAAATNYREVVRLRPQDTEARAHLAVALARLGDRQAALLEVDRIVSLGDSNSLGPLIRVDLGIVLTESHLWEFALEQFDACLLADPESIPALDNRAICLHMLGRDEDARNVLERALEIDPSDIAALQNLIRLLRKHGENERAIEAVQRLLAVQPDDEWGRAQLHELAQALEP